MHPNADRTNHSTDFSTSAARMPRRSSAPASALSAIELAAAQATQEYSRKSVRMAQNAASSSKIVPKSDGDTDLVT